MVQLDLLKYLHPGHLSRELMEKNQPFPLRFLHAARDNTPTEQYNSTSFWKIIQVNTTYWYKFFVNNNTGTTSCNIINNTQK